MLRSLGAPGLLWVSLALLLCALAREAAAQGPVGEPFQINEGASAGLNYPDVAAQPDGSFVAVWSSQDGDETGVTARLFAADGEALGPEFQVNVQTAGRQSLPAVGRNPRGAFLVSRFDRPSDSVVAATFGPSGSPELPEFVVGSADVYPGTADVATGMRSDGGFVVAWEKIHDVDGQPLSDVFQKRYAADGTPLSGEFQISDNEPYGWSFSYAPDVGVDQEDNFLVVWHTQIFIEFVSAWRESYGSSSDLLGQRFGGRLFGDGFESGDTSEWSLTAP